MARYLIIYYAPLNTPPEMDLASFVSVDIHLLLQSSEDTDGSHMQEPSDETN